MRIHVVGRGSENLLLPGGRELLGALVVASQAVDTALDQNQAELGVLVLASEKEERRIRTRRLPCETPERSLFKRGAFQCGIQKV
jgi:hypothetical protein